MSRWNMGLAITTTIALAACVVLLRSAARDREIIRRLLAQRPVEQPAAAVQKAPSAQSEPVSVPAVSNPPLQFAGTVTNEEFERTAYVAGPGEARDPPELPEHVRQGMAAFERAMDKEFDRLEGRAAESGDAAEKDTIARLQAQMLKLDQLRAQAEAAPEGTERDRLKLDMQTVMGQIISLGYSQRRQRITELARAVGYADEKDIAAFIEEIDRIYRETHLDWAALFNRGP